MTRLFFKDIADALKRDCFTISNIADMMGTNRNIVRILDKERLAKFVSVIKASEIPELEKVWRMLGRRMEGIVAHAEHHISNGPIEGTNNMVKTLRRQAYGFRDTRYFFLKIWEKSRRHTKCRDFSSPQKCA